MRPVLLVIGLLVAGCRLPNPDHCVNKHVDSDAWCARNLEGRPYCSPCVEEDHGCVAARPDPDACPAYAPDSTGADASSSGGSSTGSSSTG